MRVRMTHTRYQFSLGANSGSLRGMFGPVRHVVFDLDGTLVDTMPSVIRGLKAAVERALGREVDTRELVASFGPAPVGVLRKWIPEEAVPEALAYWLEFDNNLGPDELRPFEGAEEMLAGLKAAGVGLYLFTGRDRAGTVRILRLHEWLGRYFSEDQLRCGDDGFAPKPSSEGLSALLETHGLPLSDVLMVGDHPADMVAGRDAGVKTAAVLWDLPPGEGTNRSRFRKAWLKWEGVPVDLRLVEPKSLLSWLRDDT